MGLLKGPIQRGFPTPSNFIAFTGVLILLHHQAIPGSAPKMACSAFIVTINTAVKISTAGPGGNGIMVGENCRQAAATAIGNRT
jgi:hypothetical protein